MDMTLPGSGSSQGTATAVSCKSKITVLVAHPCPLVAAGLLATLNQLPECEVSIWDPSQHDRTEKLWLSEVDVVISDSVGDIEHLAPHVHGRDTDCLGKLKILLVTSIDVGTTAVPDVESVEKHFLSLRCGKEDLFDAVRRLGESEIQPGRHNPQSVGRKKIQSEDSHPNAKTLVVNEEDSFFAHQVRTNTINCSKQTNVVTERSVGTGKNTLTRGGIAPGALRRVREHVERRLSETLELSELAAVAGLSQCHFSRAFKQSVGETPHRYLMQRRVTAAIELIKHTDQRLTDISLSVGFSDQSHFTRTFVKLTGETPRAFRHRHR
jgi:AraC-like DNA-binding protein